MEKKNLEHIFKKGLQDFEASPPEHLWENISKEIAPEKIIPEKKHKKAVPLWYAVGGIAASLLLFYVFIFNYSNNNKIENIVSSDTIEYCSEEALVENNSSLDNNNKELETEESLITTLSEKEKLFNNTRSLEKSSIKESSITALPEKNTSLENDNSLEKSSIKESSITAIPEKNTSLENDNSLVTKERENNSEISAVSFSDTKNDSSINKSGWKSNATKNTSKPEYIVDQNDESKSTDVASTKSKLDLEKIKESAKIPILKEEISNDTSAKKDLDNINELSDTELIALLIEENDPIETKETPSKKWGIQPQVGSYGYTSLTGGSTINSEFNDNAQFTESGLNYGVRISYQASHKIKIRTGFTYTNINITTQDIGIRTSLNFQPESEFFSDNDLEVGFVNLDNSGNSEADSTNDFTNVISEEIFTGTPAPSIPIQEEVGIEDIDEPTTIPEGNEEAIFDPVSPNEESSNIRSGNISQKIEYLEFPIEVSYNLIDKKIGLDIIGGFSTFILTNNESIFENTDNNGSVFLGETTSLKNTSFSSNIGFSVDYSIAKNLSFNLEPIIKFQFNSFDTTTDYTPILFGLSSGVVWKF